MKSLFLRIFLSYWLAQALFVVLAIIVASALRPSREISNLQSQEATFLSEAVQAYQTGGEAATWKYLRGVHEAHHVRVFIADEQGRDLLGRTPPPWVRARPAAARCAPPRAFGDVSGRSSFSALR